MGVPVKYTVGTMIEVPRAALIADQIAQDAEFFSFGTNDLTQMTFGYSRDDVAKFLPDYLQKGLLPHDPFSVLDQEGVGELIKIGIERGRRTRPDLKIGICGEHGGRAVVGRSSVPQVGMTYVSCSAVHDSHRAAQRAQARIREREASAEGGAQRLDIGGHVGPPGGQVKLPGARIVLECLKREGVDIIFGLPGGAVLPIYDALYDFEGLRHILVRQEAAAGHAAEGYARATGRVGVCLVTSGPAATNLVTALQDALMDSIPIVAFTGQVPTHLIGNDAFQEADNVGITRSADQAQLPGQGRQGPRADHPGGVPHRRRPDGPAPSTSICPRTSS